MRKVVFVCTGNTCRSPMAEALFRDYLKKNNICNIEVSSYGLMASIGEPISQNALDVCKAYGVDAFSHKARQLTPLELKRNTFFVCMTSSHATALSQYVDTKNIFVLNISDPFGQNIAVYQQCAEEMVQAFPKIVERFLLDLTISKMVEEDIISLAEIEKECFIHPWSETSLQEELRNSQSRFFVAKTMGDTVGYIGATNVLGEVYMANLAVKSAYRHRGIASELLTKLIEISTEENADFVTLEVRKSNLKAISLYEHFGFQQVGERKNFYTEPDENALLFTKILK